MHSDKSVCRHQLWQHNKLSVLSKLLWVTPQLLLHSRASPLKRAFGKVFAFAATGRPLKSSSSILRLFRICTFFFSNSSAQSYRAFSLLFAPPKVSPPRQNVSSSSHQTHLCVRMMLSPKRMRKIVSEHALVGFPCRKKGHSGDAGDDGPKPRDMMLTLRLPHVCTLSAAARFASSHELFVHARCKKQYYPYAMRLLSRINTKNTT